MYNIIIKIDSLAISPGWIGIAVDRHRARTCLGRKYGPRGRFEQAARDHRVGRRVAARSSGDVPAHASHFHSTSARRAARLDVQQRTHNSTTDAHTTGGNCTGMARCNAFARRKGASGAAHARCRGAAPLHAAPWTARLGD